MHHPGIDPHKQTRLLQQGCKLAKAEPAGEIDDRDGTAPCIGLDSAGDQGIAFLRVPRAHQHRGQGIAFMETDDETRKLVLIPRLGEPPWRSAGRDHHIRAVQGDAALQRIDGKQPDIVSGRSGNAQAFEKPGVARPAVVSVDPLLDIERQIPREVLESRLGARPAHCGEDEGSFRAGQTYEEIVPLLAQFPCETDFLRKFFGLGNNLVHQWRFRQELTERGFQDRVDQGIGVSVSESLEQGQGKHQVADLVEMNDTDPHIASL